MKKVGICSRTLGKDGRGLTLDQPTRKRLHEVAAAYRVEDTIQKDENPHCPLREENERLMEDMMDMMDMKDVEDMTDLPF